MSTNIDQKKARTLLNRRGFFRNQEGAFREQNGTIVFVPGGGALLGGRHADLNSALVSNPAPQATSQPGPQPAQPGRQAPASPPAATPLATPSPHQGARPGDVLNLSGGGNAVIPGGPPTSGGDGQNRLINGVWYDATGQRVEGPGTSGVQSGSTPPPPPPPPSNTETTVTLPNGQVVPRNSEQGQAFLASQSGGADDAQFPNRDGDGKLVLSTTTRTNPDGTKTITKRDSLGNLVSETTTELSEAGTTGTGTGTTTNQTPADDDIFKPMLALGKAVGTSGLFNPDEKARLSSMFADPIHEFLFRQILDLPTIEEQLEALRRVLTGSSTPGDDTQPPPPGGFIDNDQDGYDDNTGLDPSGNPKPPPGDDGTTTNQPPPPGDDGTGTDPNSGQDFVTRITNLGYSQADLDKIAELVGSDQEFQARIIGLSPAELRVELDALLGGLQAGPTGDGGAGQGEDLLNSGDLLTDLEKLIRGRLEGSGLDAIGERDLADFERSQALGRDQSIEELNRLGLVDLNRGAGASADVLGAFDEGTSRGRLDINAQAQGRRDRAIDSLVGLVETEISKTESDARLAELRDSIESRDQLALFNGLLSILGPDGLDLLADVFGDGVEDLVSGSLEAAIAQGGNAALDFVSNMGANEFQDFLKGGASPAVLSWLGSLPADTVVATAVDGMPIFANEAIGLATTQAGAGAGAGLGVFAGAALVVGGGLAMRWAANTFLGEIRAPTPSEMANISDSDLKVFFGTRAGIGGSESRKVARIMYAIEAKRRGIDLDLPELLQERIIKEAKELGINTADLISVFNEAHRERNAARSLVNEDDLF